MQSQGLYSKSSKRTPGSGSGGPLRVVGLAWVTPLLAFFGPVGTKSALNFECLVRQAPIVKSSSNRCVFQRTGLALVSSKARADSSGVGRACCQQCSLFLLGT